MKNKKMNGKKRRNIFNLHSSRNRKMWLAWIVIVFMIVLTATSCLCEVALDHSGVQVVVDGRPKPTHPVDPNNKDTKRFKHILLNNNRKPVVPSTVKPTEEPVITVEPTEVIESTEEDSDIQNSRAIIQQPTPEPTIAVENTITPSPEPVAAYGGYVSLSDYDKHLIAATIWLEGRGESIECQYAIGSVILNRHTTESRSIYSIVCDPDQFDLAYSVSHTTPTETQYNIVEDLCNNGPTIPVYVKYFRAGCYHSWSGMNNYTAIDNTYFSYASIDYNAYLASAQ